MYVRNQMTKDLVTVTPESSITKTVSLFEKKGYSQIPVVIEGKLVGLITEKILREVSPSKATSLSIYEINYLLAKTKARDIMEENVITGSPNMFLEEAAMILRDKDIGSLPIIDEDMNLVGMITRTDITNAFIRLMGCDDKGTRISIEAENEPGSLADITNMIKDDNINIISVSNVIDKSGLGQIVLRLNTSEVDELVNKLNEAQFFK
jgi:acetoin utilization protein AcuB